MRKPEVCAFAAKAVRPVVETAPDMAAARSRNLGWLLPALALAFPATHASTARAQSEPAPTGANAPTGDAPLTNVPTVRRVQDQQPAGPLVPQAQAGASIDPAKDKNELVAQGQARPTLDPGLGTVPSHVFSDDWWSHVHPVVELHGYFRTRGEMYHNFSLGRADTTGQLWPRPLDDSYEFVDRNGNRSGGSKSINLCGNGNVEPCKDKTQAFGNMRLRLNPELHISDNLRVMSQIDALDNVVLGSTPADYGTGATRGYSNDTQNAPTAGVNGTRNSIDVKRVWAEYTTPVGQVRFGRMPTHWGLGMLYNDGNGIDQDYQSNNDRIQFVTGLRSIDLYAGGSWDFANTGATSATPSDVNGGQPYNVANRQNAGQWTLFVARRTNPELQRSRLMRGNVVVNGGIFNVFRTQGLDYARGNTSPNTADASNGFEHRGLTVYTPDLWLQILWRKLRIEAEAAAHLGSVDQTADYRLDPANPESVKIRQFGFAAQAEYKAVEDKLRLQFGSGWASGDPWAASLNASQNGTELNNGRGPISTFAFNPAYNVDLIFHRNLLRRVQGTYFFKPSVEYDFIRNPNGQKFGGGASFVWTRASQFVQTPGSKRDLGVEIDLQVYYQAKDGTLNDDPNKMGGFYAMLQYGAFFPLGGLQYPEVVSTATPAAEVSTAQVIRLHLGVVF